MGRRMKFPFLSKSTQPPSTSWPWPTCKSPKTLSFRAIGEAGASPEDVSSGEGEAVETMIDGLRSDRLFFEPGGETRSIMEEIKLKEEGIPFKESVVMAMESTDPFLDFKKSMEEMVEAFGLKDMDCLQQLFHWYLSVNSKVNHGYIVSAFVDLLVGFLDQEKSDDDQDSLSTITGTTSTNYSALSFSYSTSSLPCLSSLESEKSVGKYSCSSSNSFS